MRISERLQLRCVIALVVSLAMLIVAGQVVLACGESGVDEVTRIDGVCVTEVAALEQHKQDTLSVLSTTRAQLAREQEWAKARWGEDDPATLRRLAKGNERNAHTLYERANDLIEDTLVPASQQVQELLRQAAERQREALACASGFGT